MIFIYRCELCLGMSRHLEGCPMADELLEEPESDELRDSNASHESEGDRDGLPMDTNDSPV